MPVHLRRIELFHLAVPLRSRIAHASHARTTSDNLVVRVHLSDGTIGHGEGVPRPYVTGETIETTFGALRKHDAAGSLGVVSTFEEAVGRVRALALAETGLDPRGMAGNAARCALEIALIDALGRHFGRSAGDAVAPLAADASRVSARPEPIRYSGAITAASPRKERVSAWKMRLYGFRDVKLKVGVAGQDDAARLRAVRRILGGRVDLRIDANESWRAEELVERVAPLLAARPSLLEQPVSHEEVGALAEIRPRLGVPVMLDESLCGWPDGERAVAEGLADAFNVRLSKCGGIGPSLRLMELAWSRGLMVQLGCHPGETGILSAAGRHVATRLPGIRFLEGSYDRHVLAENAIVEDITFRYGGRAGPIEGPGLGVTVSPARLERMTVRHEVVDHD